jgi:Tat protein secretion system quality control protein TatD with DNase activity
MYFCRNSGALANQDRYLHLKAPMNAACHHARSKASARFASDTRLDTKVRWIGEYGFDRTRLDRYSKAE